MSEIEVRIVKLEQMRMLSSYGFGPNPESIAWDKLIAFCLEKGLFKKDNYRPTYGFNNPNPSVGSPNYGYEIWIIPDGGLPTDSDAKEVEFEGGLYAVAHCPSLEVIGQIWQKLVAWRDTSEYTRGSHQWLEELIQPWETGKTEADFAFYLSLPIKK